jgi:hypothetical protein
LFSGHRLGAIQGKRPRKHGHRPEHPPLILIQQLVTPLHSGGQGLLPRRRQPVPVGQQREPVAGTPEEQREAAAALDHLNVHAVGRFSIPAGKAAELAQAMQELLQQMEAIGRQP